MKSNKDYYDKLTRKQYNHDYYMDHRELKGRRKTPRQLAESIKEQNKESFVDNMKENPEVWEAKRKQMINQLNEFKNNNRPERPNYKELANERLKDYEKKSQKIKQGMSGRELRDVYSYTEVSFVDINEYLHQGKPIPGSDFTEDELKTRINTVDKLVGQSTLEEDTVLYRGTIKGHYDKYKEGDTFSYASFVSTSASKGVADEFKKYRDDRITIEIRVPKGTKGVYLGDMFSSQNEKEVLLDRNLEFKVVKKDYRNEKNKSTLILESQKKKR